MINANYRCEVNHNHLTFTSRVTEQNFVEIHHLIPMAFQEDFNYSLDVPANVVAVCPNCHRQLHHAEKQVTARFLRLLFNKRQAAIGLAGISLSIETLFKCYRIS